MLENSVAEQSARHLLEEHRMRKPFCALPAALAPRSLAEARAAQEAFVRLLTEQRGPVAGYKVALTTPTMQKLTGFSEPAYGMLFERRLHSSPHVIHGAEFVRLGLECEVAIRMAADLPATGAPYSADSVSRAIGTMMPAFEIIEDRAADYSQFAARVLDFIADNTWNAGVVLGVGVAPAQAGDLGAARGRMFINEKLIAEGHGRDVLGHPLNALVWLVNNLAADGKGLQRGMVVMTGSLVPTQFIKPGDAVRYTLDGFGEIRCTVV